MGRGGSRWPTPRGSRHHHFGASTIYETRLRLAMEPVRRVGFFSREDPWRCPIRVVLSSLQQGLERRLSPSTLKVYVLRTLLTMTLWKGSRLAKTAPECPYCRPCRAPQSPSTARRGGASGARPSLDESMGAGRGLGAICSDLSGSHMCKFHSIAQSPCFPGRLLCHFPRGLQSPLNLPYAPKWLSICVSASKTFFGKDGASATFSCEI